MKIGRFARWYRLIEHAAFGRALERRRFAFLGRLAEARRILILGEGDGRVLERLLNIAPIASFVVVEVSPEMIALARQRTKCPDRVTFLCNDARTAQWPGQYDAIVTLFFLDCFTRDDANTLIHSLTRGLIPGGTWLVSEFAIPRRGWRRIHARIWIGIMYRFFRITTGLQTRSLPPIEDLMRKAAMERIDYEEERAGLMISEVWRKPG